MLVTKIAQIVNRILDLSPTYFVSNIRQQHRYNPVGDYRLVIDISTKKFYDWNKHSAFDVKNCYFGLWITAWCKKSCFKVVKRAVLATFWFKKLWWLIKLPMIFAWLRFFHRFQPKINRNHRKMPFWSFSFQNVVQSNLKVIGFWLGWFTGSKIFLGNLPRVP